MNDKNKYLTLLGAWALAFGCSVGWGSFVMPGSTFLPVGGPIGTTIGIALGGVVMIVLGINFNYLMNKYPDKGGTYTYTKLSFGYDHGFLSAWFLVLTYIAIIWANATALPLIGRTVLGDVFQFGFNYEIAGFHVYLGEIILAISSIIIAALICLNKKLSQLIQSIMAVVLFVGVVACFIIAASNGINLEPAYAPSNSSSFNEIFTIFALAPWAYVGFESITHSAHEAKFDLKNSLMIFFIAVVTAAIAYIVLSLLAVTALPEGCASWTDYIFNLGKYSGVMSQPTFYGIYNALGDTGLVILGICALCGIFTGLIGNYVALSRLLSAVSEDGLLPGKIGELDKNMVPRNAILAICGISIILPFFGRTAISWIVDVTTVGATIAYAFASASAIKTAKKHGDKNIQIVGLMGVLLSLLFALEFLIPNLISVKTLSTESYFILAAWGILGFIYFRRMLKKDNDRKFGRSNVALIVMLGLIIFASSVWMKQKTEADFNQTINMINQNEYTTVEETEDYIQSLLRKTNSNITISITIQVALIVVAIAELFMIYSHIQSREKQIEVEKVLAEESSRAKTSFLSNMSHEIRTPMNAIIGLDNIALREPNLSPKTREHLEKIGSSAKHLLGLINDILDMSRIESGRMVLKNEEFSFREFLDQINIIINGQCLDKGLHYECNIKGQVKDYYYGDDMKLKQVLINILGNSVKFTNAPGEVTLSVEQINSFEGRCTLRFEMKDTGIGMDEEFIPKIFEAFSQEDATTTNKYGGSGLGMAITKNFVEMMNGDIEVQSKKGVGSTFIVTVTLKESSRSASLEQNLTLPKNINAFVIDDDEIACEHTQVVLRAIGIDSITNTNAKEALDLIKYAYDEGTPYNLVLTDYKMPDMNGLDLTKEIRKFDNNTTSIIMLTGYNWDIIDEEAREQGIDGILAKPLFSDSLSKEIYRVFNLKNGDKEESIEQTKEITENVLAGKRILMAEDVEQNAEILADLLELEDMLSERAENGQEAIDMFNNKPAGYYDLILMDVRMPIKDGLTATKEIRNLDREDAKTIPIIAMTANVFDEDIEKSLQAGMNAHLSKPIEPDHLYETMAKFVKK